MSSLFRLLGTYAADPSVGTPSADPSLTAPIDERITLAKKHSDEVILTVDTFVALSFGGIANAHVIILKVPAAKVIARMTSADGTQQTFPVEELLILTSTGTPYTAIDLQRAAGVITTVKVFLGEKA